ncbi:GatB/YqeY domain-containing protein [Candidatus Methylocalor cossyra]|uniref:Glutamyl-tRNA amidotransferase n=1 Tax=Candidatus Methylocalor cossyra TaxID=3108543 RepID=A0ABM9NL82_9GAMM
MSALKERLQADMKTAMKAGEKDRLGVIRLIMAAIKQREVDERIALDDTQVIAVLDKMVKQRREAIAQYQAGGREDLAAVEKDEIKIIQSYLPEPLSDADLQALIRDAIAETGASGIAAMGKVMALLKPKVQGRADLSEVSAKVKAALGG